MALPVELEHPEELLNHLVAVMDTLLGFASLFNAMLADDGQEFVELTGPVHLQHVILDGGVADDLRVVGKVLIMGVAMRVAANSVKGSVLVLLILILAVEELVRGN